MNRRALGFAAVVIPATALLALLVWAQIRSGGVPGGLGINATFGEITVTKGTAPPLALPLLGGGSIELADLKGKVVMVDFWSSWCPPCIKEAPVLAATYREYAGQEVEFLGVAIWDEESEVTRYIQRYDMTYPNGIDARGRIAINYGVRGIPEKYFIDSDGQLVRKFVGPMTTEGLRAIIDDLLSLEG